MVHLNVFNPILKPVTCDEGVVGAVTELVPVTTLHAAVPTIGEFADKVAEDEQTVCVIPALATVGTPSL